MKRIFITVGAIVIAIVAAVAYASGRVDLPTVCDPAETIVEIPGQWGAKVVSGDCAGKGAQRAVVVLDNDYAFERKNCVVFRTRTEAPIAIAFHRENELVIRTDAALAEQVTYEPECGPVTVKVQRARQS